MVAFLALATLVLSPPHFPLKYAGMYVEGCSCAPPCKCELTGVEMGCQGVGGFVISSGTYHGQSIAGTKMAYATEPGKWVLVYTDAGTPAKQKAVAALAKAALSGFGKIEAVRSAKIALTGGGGKYRLRVDGGKVMDMTTVPILGGDKKTPLTYSNTNGALHPTVLQGKVVKCAFNDHGHKFSLSDSNAYFNPKLNITTKL